MKRSHRHLVGIDLRCHHKIRDCDVAQVEAVDLPVECELPDRERDGIGLCSRTGRRRRRAGGSWLRRLVGAPGLAGENVVKRRQVEGVRPQTDLSRRGAGFGQVDLAGQLQFVFRAVGGGELQHQLAQVQQLLLHRSVQVQPDALRRLRQFVFRSFDDQVGDIEIAFDGGLALGVVVRAALGVQGNRNEPVRRQSGTEERQERALVPIGGAEVHRAGLFVEVKLAGHLEFAFGAVVRRERHDKLAQRGQLLFQSGVELDAGAQRRLGQLVLRVVDDKVRVIARVAFGVQREGDEFVRRERRREKRAERILVEVHRLEDEFARVFRRVVLAGDIETAARFGTLAQGECDASKLGHVVFDADIEIESGLVILQLVIAVSPGEITQHKVARRARLRALAQSERRQFNCSGRGADLREGDDLEQSRQGAFDRRLRAQVAIGQSVGG